MKLVFIKEIINKTESFDAVKTSKTQYCAKYGHNYSHCTHGFSVIGRE